MLEEREITGPVNLCDDRGRLNPEAVGWSRRPVHTCNLRGPWLRRKRWHYWNITGPDRMLAVTVASVDYLSFVGVQILDFPAKESHVDLIPRMFSDGGVGYPETVLGEVLYVGRKAMARVLHEERRARLEIQQLSFLRRMPVSARIDIAVPEGHETLNVVVPWSESRFQFTSKQHCLPAWGQVRIGGRTLDFPRGECFACLDFGRGVWPYRTEWNWASCSTRQGEHVIGLNFGARWTDGTGMNENGILVDGKVEKIHEDVSFDYDRRDFMAPWTLRTRESGQVDLTFRPFHNLRSGLQLGLVSTRVNQLFGRYSGTIEHGGRRLEIRDAVGWAEEHRARW